MNLLRRFSALTLLSFSFVLLSAATWDLNDVSILMPLPAHLTLPGEDSLLRADSVASGGVLLPRVMFDSLPTLANMLSSVETYPALRVVGIRIDPDFAGTGRAQIRMVWQPLAERLLVSGSTQVLSFDAAIHTFYELTQPEFKIFIRELGELQRRLGVFTAGLPLGIHPVLAAQGVSGPFGSALIQLILSKTGASRLSRITVMALQGRGNEWEFSGFDVVGGALKPISIPRVDSVVQTMANSATPPDRFETGATPAAAEHSSKDVIDAFLADSNGFVKSSSPPAITQIVNSLHRIENPLIHTPETIDCASCHVAQPARLWLNRESPAQALLESPFKFVSKMFNLSNLSATQRFTNGLRAFGYQGMKPAVSQRTIHESAVVAERLNAEWR